MKVEIHPKVSGCTENNSPCGQTLHSRLNSGILLTRVGDAHADRESTKRYGRRPERRSRQRLQNPSRVLFPSLATPSVRSVSGGLRALEAWRTMASCWREGFGFLFRLFFGVFFGMVRGRLHSEVRIRSSPLYPHSGGASSAGGGRVESFVWRISWDLVYFFACWCGFKPVSSDLRLSLLSSLVIVAALVR